MQLKTQASFFALALTPHLVMPLEGDFGTCPGVQRKESGSNEHGSKGCSSSQSQISAKISGRQTLQGAESSAAHEARANASTKNSEAPDLGL